MYPVWCILIFFSFQTVLGFAPHRNMVRMSKLTLLKVEMKNREEKDVTSEWNTSLFPAKDFSKPVKPMRTFISKEREAVQELYTQTLAGVIGISTGVSVAGFKLSIEAVRTFCYGDTVLAQNVPWFLLPALGGLVVSLLSLTGDFSPGLKGAVKETDNSSLSYGSAITTDKVLGRFRSLRKAAAAIATLGTGNSLGPEGPGVEIGAAISKIAVKLWPPDLLGSIKKEEENMNFDRISDRLSRNRLFLACGAAAGVSSGFNAPLAGVFFALEVVQSAIPSIITITTPSTNEFSNEDASINGSITPMTSELREESLSANSGSIAAILISSALAALVARVFLGDELVLKVTQYDIQTPLTEIPLYILLGGCCGLVEVVFSQAAKKSRTILNGKEGPKVVKDFFNEIPTFMLPTIGGLICGCVGLVFPQILFFGYETLNALLGTTKISTFLLLSLLVAKIFTTAVSAGSGLVGGTLAPSLFLGAMTGAAFHNIICQVLVNLHIPETIHSVSGSQIIFDLAGVPVYASIGAASVLAALFRAPLTACLLLFEVTRDYDILLPLLASAGVATLASDIIENSIENKK
jgi:H+/Cl- antiporter ClcA